MAAAAPSPLASSVEKTNGAKLSRLLIDGGTTVLRVIFDHYHPPGNLLADLHGNYLTLNNLLRKRVLHRPQWDLLFPPGGATPDSNTFDITLLFLLLTNICGLSRPLSFWHTKPPPGDTSLEANLARIKFFRNELYGHVSTTGVDTPTFSALWVEISAVLAALGLHPTEIDRLKAERCGEEDYIDVLLDWADSEEDIKSQLRDISKSQTKVQHAVGEVRQTQLEDREMLQYSKGKLEEVHQFQTITQETIDEVRQSQLQDREIIEDSNIKLQEVYQIDRKTHQVVTDIRQTQTDDSRAFRQMCHNTEQGVARLHETLQGTKSKVEEISQSHEELKQTVENMEGQREKHRQDEILKKLAKIDTLKDMKHHTERYVEGTRLSIFAKVENWLDDISSPNRVMVISGAPGMGKSVISAVTCHKMLEEGRLAGSHFCQHDRARHRNPKVMLQSLACHLADSLPDYQEALVQKLSRNLGVEINDMEVKDLFELLFEEPLTSLNGPGPTYLMVIDGLDESEYQGRNELLDVIANYFRRLPLWIRFLVTTRPEINITDKLKCLHPMQLEQDNEENLKDIHLCLKNQLRHLLQAEYQGIILQELVRKSEGVMLYAHYLVDLIKKNVVLTPEQLDSTFPSGISSVYHSYFERLETDLRKELNITEEQFMNFLSAVAAAREPLPLGFVSKLLLSGTRKSISAVRRKVNVAIACVSALLPVQDGCIHFFHKSVKDWLIENSKYVPHHFSVDDKEGHQVLSKLCIDELDDVKRKGVESAQFSDITKYALQHGVQHMLQLEEDARVCSLEDVVHKYVLDIEIVYAKLCVNVTSASEDILCLQKQDCMRVLFVQYQRSLDTLLYLLRKHTRLLTELPHAIFQILLNEGGPEMSSQVISLLETKYCEIPYMEYLRKKDLQEQELLQTRFQCSAAVACFDVSSKLDYMVCECQDATIQLWSLHTGKLVWTRPVMVRKLYTDFHHAYRSDPSYERLSHYGFFYDRFPSSPYLFYRSVVFHPTEELVLPGVLSHAYNFEGDRKPLFPLSNCSFSVCSISGKQNAMLTDSPDDTKSIIMWSLTNGSEIDQYTGNEEILSFAWSCDGRLLAISYSTGMISLVDVKNGFKTLAQTTTSKVCGMIKFSPDCRFLFCWHFPRGNDHYLFRINVEMNDHCNFSLDVSLDKVSYEPWEFESCSETGFLLGDPISCLFKGDSGVLRFAEGAFAFVLNEQTVLRGFPGSTFINMLYVDKLANDREASKSIAKNILFSTNGETVYVVNNAREIMAWDVSSGELKAKKRTGSSDCVVTVREGVLQQDAERSSTFELWNFELSECILKWTDLKDIRHVYSISEERVACLQMGVKVTILDTSNGDIVSTIQTFHGKFVACNSNCQLVIIIYDFPRTIRLWDDGNVLWEKSWFSHSLHFLYFPGIFSPEEQFVVIPGTPPAEHSYEQGLFVIDAASGKTLHLLCTGEDIFGCRFVSDEECVVNSYDVSRGFCLRLFNIRSGDLLSVITMENRAFCLAACPRKLLIAIGFTSSKPNFKVIKVKLQGTKYDRKYKRYI